MPANPDDRATYTIGAELVRAVRERAEAEGRTTSAVVVDALRAYLDGAPRPAEAGLPGLAPAERGLHAEVRAMLAVLQQMMPRVAKVADDHDELMDTVDEIVSELGRREGAALALEQIAAMTETPRR